MSDSDPARLPRRLTHPLTGVTSVSFTDDTGELWVVVNEGLDKDVRREEAVVALRGRSRRIRGMFGAAKGVATAMLAVGLVAVMAYSSGAVSGVQEWLNPPQQSVPHPVDVEHETLSEPSDRPQAHDDGGEPTPRPSAVPDCTLWGVMCGPGAAVPPWNVTLPEGQSGWSTPPRRFPSPSVSALPTPSPTQESPKPPKTVPPVDPTPQPTPTVGPIPPEPDPVNPAPPPLPEPSGTETGV